MPGFRAKAAGRSVEPISITDFHCREDSTVTRSLLVALRGTRGTSPAITSLVALDEREQCVFALDSDHLFDLFAVGEQH